MIFWVLKYYLNFDNFISHLYINFFQNHCCDNTAYTACLQICTTNIGSVSQLPGLEMCCLDGYTWAYVLFNIHLQLFVSVKFGFDLINKLELLSDSICCFCTSVIKLKVDILKTLFNIFSLTGLLQ